MDLKTILINLKVLGSLETGMKLNTREKNFIIDDITWWQSAARLYRRDSRDVTYEKLVELIGSLSSILSSKDGNSQILAMNYKSIEDFVLNLKNILLKAIEGLKKLKETYILDVTFVSQLEIEIENLKRIHDHGMHTHDKLD